MELAAEQTILCTPLERNALAPFEDMQEAWKAGKAALAKVRLKFNGNPGLDDTADTYYACTFPNTAEGKRDMDNVTAGVAAARMLKLGRCSVRGIVTVDSQTSEMRISKGSVIELKRMIPQLQIDEAFVTAGRAV